MIIKVSATGIHKNALEVREYPIAIGFAAALKLFMEVFPNATQVCLVRTESTL